MHAPSPAQQWRRVGRSSKSTFHWSLTKAHNGHDSTVISDTFISSCLSLLLSPLKEDDNLGEPDQPPGTTSIWMHSCALLPPREEVMMNSTLMLLHFLNERNRTLSRLRVGGKTGPFKLKSNLWRGLWCSSETNEGLDSWQSLRSRMKLFHLVAPQPDPSSCYISSHGWKGRFLSWDIPFISFKQKRQTLQVHGRWLRLHIRWLRSYDGLKDVRFAI